MIMPEQKNTEWATIGKIVALFGIRGEVKVFPMSDIPGRFAQLESVYLTPDYVGYAIESVRPYKGDMLLLKFAGIDDVNAAETLRNCDICIPLEQLAHLPPDSYYQHDILGLQVYTLEEKEIGPIVDILPTGGNDVYVIKTTGGQQVLIPAVKAVIKQVDLRRKKMYIDPLRGMLEDDDLPSEGQSPQEHQEEE
jgi:16S rRNA processing protein RimM